MSRPPQEYVDEAKRLLVEIVSENEDPLVQVLIGALELDDDDPRVLSVATALQRKAASS